MDMVDLPCGSIQYTCRANPCCMGDGQNSGLPLPLMSGEIASRMKHYIYISETYADSKWGQPATAVFFCQTTACILLSLLTGLTASVAQTVLGANLTEDFS